MLSNQNCFKLLVKMISAFPIAQVSVIQILDDADAAFRILARDCGPFCRDHHVPDKPHRLNGRTSASDFVF